MKGTANGGRDMSVAAGQLEVAPRRKKRSAAGGSTKDHLASLAFLVPGAIWLLAVVVYPAIVTVKDSFFNETARRRSVSPITKTCSPRPRR